VNILINFMKRYLAPLFCLSIALFITGCRLNRPTQVTDIHKPSGNPPLSVPTYIPQPTENLSGLPILKDLPPGWSQIDPGGETSCARGGKYSFFVYKANSNKLLLYFEGGGSCYDAKTCRPGVNYFDDSIVINDQSDNPVLKQSGVFALVDERNPFKDYNIIFVTYCTGDAFMGTRAVNYSNGNDSITVNQVGYLNTRRVLGWVYQNYSSPDSVFVIGCSAGVVGSFFHAPYILEQYKNIPFVLIGDSGGGYLEGPAVFAENLGMMDAVPNWLPQYKDLISDDVIHTQLIFTIPANAYPNAKFGLLDNLNDSTQEEIITRFDTSLTLAYVLESNLTDIRAQAPDFYSYTGPGNYHCITQHPDFTKYEVNGVKLVDWFSNLANGQSVERIIP
jgi:hypothetical protein